ncbi:hypothetical protein D3C76_1473600 [compost metagenome]
MEPGRVSTLRASDASCVSTSSTVSRTGSVCSPSVLRSGLITCSRTGLSTNCLNGCTSSLLKTLTGGVYSPFSRNSPMVWRINAGERRMLLSVSMSASDGGMKDAFS